MSSVLVKVLKLTNMDLMEFLFRDLIMMITIRDSLGNNMVKLSVIRSLYH